MMLDQLGAKMRCKKFGKRPERWLPLQNEKRAAFLLSLRGLLNPDGVKTSPVFPHQPRQA
jgi:hypothetical protein